MKIGTKELADVVDNTMNCIASARQLKTALNVDQGDETLNKEFVKSIDEYIITLETARNAVIQSSLKMVASNVLRYFRPGSGN